MKKLLLFILFLSIFSTHAFAQLFLEQGKISLDLHPGKTATGSLIVHNTNHEESVTVKAYWEDFAYQEPFDGMKKFFSPGTLPLSCGQWVTFSPQSFSIPPSGKKKVSYVIHPPEDISGGYYGVLFFEKNAPTNAAKMGLNIVTRLGTLFFLETENSMRQATLKNISTINGQLTAKFLNTSNIILIPDGIFYILDEEGLVVDRGKIDKIYLPPNGEADYRVNFNKDIPSGQYSMILTIDLQESHVLVKEIDFTKTSNSNIEILAIRD